MKKVKEKRMHEIEVTCQVTPEVLPRLMRKLADKQPQRIVVEDDCYYDTTAATLFQQAVFVRRRATGHVCHLQFKFDDRESDKQHIECTERDFLLSSENILPEAVHLLFRRFLPHWKAALTWQEACTENALHEFVSLHKTRHIYQSGPLTICLDEVDELGMFVEAEYLCEEGAETHQARCQVAQFIAEIGGTPLAAGYVELSLRLHQPQLYQQGHYHV